MAVVSLIGTLLIIICLSQTESSSHSSEPKDRGSAVCVSYFSNNFECKATSNVETIYLLVLEYHKGCNYSNNTLPTLAIYPDCKEHEVCWIRSFHRDLGLQYGKLCVQRGNRKFWAVIKRYFIDFDPTAATNWTTAAMVTQKTAGTTPTVATGTTTPAIITEKTTTDADIGDSTTTMNLSGPTQKAARTDDDDDGRITLARGAFAGIIAVLVLLLLLLIILIIVVIVLYRRFASSGANNTQNTDVTYVQPHMFELSSGENGLYSVPYDCTEITAPVAGSTNATKPSDNVIAQPPVPPQTSSLNDVTLIENDLYE